jgi:DNA-binding transcriptional LysR family regulator
MPAISQAFRCFDEVARRGSVRKASATLHLTAAAVNQQILNLEAQVGQPLFDRLPRGMQLTVAGEIVLAAVRRSQRDFDNALAQVEDLNALRHGHVSVGVPHATAEYLVPQVIAAMHHAIPISPSACVPESVKSCCAMWLRARSMWPTACAEHLLPVSRRCAPGHSPWVW